MADVFISYSKTHADVTRRLAQELEKLDLSVWWDTELVAGESYRQRIQKEIGDARAAIVIWTSDSINSEFVISEASRAHAQRKLVQVRTSDVEISDIPPPFDVSHVPLVDDRKSITGALRQLGLLGDAIVRDETVRSPGWGRQVQPLRTDDVARRGLPLAVSALLVCVIGYVGISMLGTSTRSPAPVTGAAVGPVAQPAVSAPKEDFSRQALGLTGELLRMINAGLPDSSLLDADVRLGQRGLTSRAEAAEELRRFGARFANVNCRADTQSVEVRSLEHASAGYRAKVAVVCDLTERQGRTQTKRFPLEIEAVKSGEAWRIAGMWQPEEMVLWQRRERGK